MDREKVNEYFLNLINDIIKEVDDWRLALVCASGGHYEENETLLDAEEEVTCRFNVEIKFGATKLVIISKEDNEYAKNYVAKIPFDYIAMDYCEEEKRVYKAVLEDYLKFKDCFAECWYADRVLVKDYDNTDCLVPVYIMQRAEIDEIKVEKLSYNYWINSGGNPDYYYPEDTSEETMNCFRNFYEEIFVEEFEETISDLGVNDLHSGNIGFINGNPVLVDYSGYYG